LLAAAGLWAQEDSNDVADTTDTAKVYVIPCQGLIDDGLKESISRRTQLALEDGAGYIIYEIDTLGGLVQSAVEICDYLMLEEGKDVNTVAYITKKAISAGAMISVACRDIIMRRSTKIGDCAPVQMGGKLEGVEREKAESFIRGVFDSAAEQNNYPQALLRAMVTMQIEVYRVTNKVTGQDEYFETNLLPKDANEYDLANKELVVKDTELLTITASKALEYGIARAVVEDRSEVLSFLADRDGVEFSGLPVVLELNWSEKMVRWINHPSVMGILFMVAILGVYVEFNTPGLGLPGLVAVICFVIIVGSKYLVGLANWVEVALFVLGVLLLLVEVFVLPGFGIAGVTGIIFVLFGMFGMLIRNTPDTVPWPKNALDWQSFSEGVLGLSLGFGGFLVLAWILARYLPRMEFMSGLSLAPSKAKVGDEFEVNMTSPPDVGLVEVSLGQVGEVVSTLRPTGKVRFGDSIVDCVAQAEFLDKGTSVEIIEIHGNRVVVKKVQEQQ
jgi:membrane-bound serine protease (ClpP class)